MGNENLSGRLDDVTPTLLEDTYYDNSKNKKSSLDDLAAPVLEDTFYDNTQRKKNTLDDIAAPVLDDKVTASSVKTASVPNPTSFENLSPPILEDTFDAAAYAKQKSQKAQIQDDVSAPILLDDMNDSYKSTYVRKETADELAAKQRSKSAALQARAALSEGTDIDKKKSLEMYKALMAEKEAKLANKGFKLIFVVMALGCITGLFVYLFFSNIKPTSQNGFISFMTSFSGILSGIIVFVSVFTILRLKIIKSLASFFYGLTVVIMLISSTILFNCENISSVIVFYVGAIIISGYLCFFINTNEPIEKFFARKDSTMHY